MTKLPAKRCNQQHPPTPRKKRVDSLGNDYRSLLLKKKDGSTTTICKGVTEGEAMWIATRLKFAIEQVKTNLEGELIIIKSAKPKNKPK